MNAVVQDTGSFDCGKNYEGDERRGLHHQHHFPKFNAVGTNASTDA